MDSKNENTSPFSSIDQSLDFQDPKIADFEKHLNKRKKSAHTNTEITTESFGFAKPENFSQNNTNKSSVSHLISQHQLDPQGSMDGIQFPDPPQAILNSDTDATLESECSDLEQRIVKYIQSDLIDQSQQQPEQKQKHIQPEMKNNEVQYIIEKPQQIAASAENISSFPVQTTPSKVADTIDINMLERWLDNKPMREVKLAGWYIICIGIICACIGILIGGAIVAAYMNHKMQQKLKIEEAYHSYKLMLASRAQKPSSQHFFDTGSRNGNESDPTTGASNKSNAKALALSVPAIPLAKTCKDQPDVKMSALEGGRTKIAILSKCHQSHTVKIEYANITFKKQLDKNGKLNFILDCFAGDKQPVFISFDKKLKIVRHPKTKDLNKVTKIAVIWSGSANLNLHAFEYATNNTNQYHIWEKNPSTFEDAMKKLQKTGQGHGFLSSYKSFETGAPKVEVYTFLNSNKQKEGVIKMALDYRLQPGDIQRIACHSQDNVTIDYTTTLLVNNQKLQTNKAASILDPCKIQQKSFQTLNARAIQDIVFRR